MIVKEVDFSQYKDEVLNIRKEVFVNELNISEYNVIDNTDLDSYHIAAFNKKIIIGIGKISEDGIISKVAVLKEYRKKGLANSILFKLIKYAEENKLDSISLIARYPTKTIYEKFGFNTVGNKYLAYNSSEAIRMIKNLN